MTRKNKSFKDCLNEDNKNVFFDLSEFAEIHNIDETDTPIEIDSEKAEE